jgi:Subtilase family
VLNLCAPVTLLIFDDEIFENSDLIAVQPELLGRKTCAFLGTAASSKEVTGSSFAAPRVAGMLARLLSEFPGVTPLEAKSVLHRLADPWSKEISGSN